MKKYLYIILTGFSVLCTLCACKLAKFETSDIFTVEGVVTKVEHTGNSGGGLTVQPSVDVGGFSVGEDGLGIGGGNGYSVTTEKSTEKFLVHIWTSSGNFIVDRKDLFEKLYKDQHVIVSYKEEAFVTYDDSNRVVDRKLHGLIFFDAIPK